MYSLPSAILKPRPTICRNLPRDLVGLAMITHSIPTTSRPSSKRSTLSRTCISLFLNLIRVSNLILSGVVPSNDLAFIPASVNFFSISLEVATSEANRIACLPRACLL